jgi:hypothetical protein
MPQICNMGQAFYFPSNEEVLRIFRPEKSYGFGRA